MTNSKLLRLDSTLNKVGRYLKPVDGGYLIFPMPFDPKKHPSEAVAKLSSFVELKTYVDAIRTTR